MAENQIIKKRDAKARGLEYYYTGKPCKHGHLSQRKVKDGLCPECSKAYYSTHRKKILSQRQDYYDQHKEEVLKYQREYRKKNNTKMCEQAKERRQNNPNYNTSRVVYYWKNRERILAVTNAAQRKKYANDAQYRKHRSEMAAQYYLDNCERLKKQCNDYYHITSILKKYGE